MAESQNFEAYFNTEALQGLRALVHDLYPEVQERLTADLRPGFYPKLATRDDQALFLIEAKPENLLIYGIDGLEEADFKPFIRRGLIFEGDFLRLPWDMELENLKTLLQFVMKANFIKHGVDLIHSPGDFSGGDFNEK